MAIRLPGDPTPINPTWINPNADPLGPFASLIRGTVSDGEQS